MMEPYIDKDTDKVYCSECNQELVNMTYFTKQQLKTLKQYRPKSTSGFLVKCNDCKAQDKPTLVGGDVKCRHCGGNLDHLTRQFKLMLKQQIQEGSEIK